jgi:3-mercaptopyruvate sulfurtransferase SseA
MPAALKALLRGAGVKRGQAVVSWCYIGERATRLWLAARVLGHPARI